MSNLSTYPTPFQVVLKPGLYQSQNTKGGLNLNKWLLKFLKRIGFAVTDSECCVYFPSFPVLGVNFESTDQVPNGGIYMDADVPDSVYYRGLDGNLYVFNSEAV